MRWIRCPNNALVAFGKKSRSIYWIDKYREGFPELESPPSDTPIGLHRAKSTDRPVDFRLVGCGDHYHQMMLLAQQMEDNNE